jgi:hypothetical protein
MWIVAVIFLIFFVGLCAFSFINVLIHLIDPRE